MSSELHSGGGVSSELHSGGGVSSELHSGGGVSSELQRVIFGQHCFTVPISASGEAVPANVNNGASISASTDGS